MAKTKKLTKEELEAWKASEKDKWLNRQFEFDPDTKNPYTES